VSLLAVGYTGLWRSRANNFIIVPDMTCGWYCTTCCCFKRCDKQERKQKQAKTQELYTTLPLNLTNYTEHHTFQKLRVAHLVNKFPTFYGTPKFIALFKTACHMTLSWATWIQFTLSHPTSFRYILKVSFYMSQPFPSRFSDKSLSQMLLLLLAVRAGFMTT